ncbi:MAG: GyrI-like domain-containing protein [Bacilli bacterium]|nr:GyrI-like domain-containing protein [Bacilli bacterium]
MFRIGEFSRLAKTTIKTLRFYDEIDLFKPTFVDDNGYRYYSIDDLCKLQFILDLRNCGMPIDDIERILKGENPQSIFLNYKQELEKSLNENRKNLSLINTFINISKGGNFMNNYQAKEIMLPECIVYYRKGVIPSMAYITPFVLETGEEVKKNNPTLKCLKEDYNYIVYGADEYQEKDVELEYAQAVETYGKESENIKFKKIEKEKAISVLHKGAYKDLGKAYAYTINWIKENGYIINGKIRERYINGCWNKKDEKDYLTEIQVPVK